MGQLLRRLNELGIAENTIVIFTSDNGGLHVPELNMFASRTILRSAPGRDFVYEGGLRVPAIVRWPNSVPAGRVIDAPIVNTDWLPTLLECAGQPAPADSDGVSLAVFTGQAAAPSAPSSGTSRITRTKAVSRPGPSVRALETHRVLRGRPCASCSIWPRT